MICSSATTAAGPWRSGGDQYPRAIQVSGSSRGPCPPSRESFKLSLRTLIDSLQVSLKNSEVFATQYWDTWKATLNEKVDLLILLVEEREAKYLQKGGSLTNSSSTRNLKIHDAREKILVRLNPTGEETLLKVTIR